MTFNVKEPVDTLFTAVDKIAKIVRIANSPLSDQQKIDMGYIILKKCKTFSIVPSEMGHPTYGRQKLEQI